MARRKLGDGPPVLSEDDKIIREAQDRFKRWWEWESSFVQLYWQDVKFANADSDNHWQWPDDIYNSRGKRPSLTINKTQHLCRLISNDTREDMPAISVKASSDDASAEAAQIWGDIIRDIEYQSGAEDIYIGAHESQIEGGIGYWRVTHDYIDENSFNQELFVRGFTDQMSVALDCDAKRKDGLDSMWGFVVENIPNERFEIEYPDVEPNPNSTALEEAAWAWMSSESTRVAEYYRIVEKKDELIYMEDAEGNGATIRMSDVRGNKDLAEQIENAAYHPQTARMVQDRRARDH
jgi:hypothetical protein